LITLEKTPLQTRGDIDTNIDKNDVIRILQKYKTAKQKYLKKRIHLFWNPDKKTIEWDEAAKSDEQRSSDTEKEMKKELSKMRNHIDFDSKQIEEIQEQYNAALICMLVEEWIESLTGREAQVLFMAYINHDYEPWKGRYRGLSDRRIGDFLNVSEITIRREKESAIKKCIESSDYF
jgi:DNA-directed RNA polymerase specialized sigma subunit